MSHDSHAAPVAASPYLSPIGAGCTHEALAAKLTAQFGLARDSRNATNLSFMVSREQLHAVAAFLRDDPELRFDTLVDVVGVDYLTYPGHRGARFGVIYILKSTVFRHRVQLKAEVEEGEEELPTVSDLWRIADWAEREVFDLIGIRFAGHPNLRRILNHHEFIGHPLRKDYPCQKRQKLSVNDPMVDQLEARLKAKGFQVVSMGEQHGGEHITDVPKVSAGAAS